MNIRSLLILLFVAVALIPISLLSAISAYSIIKLQEQISNMYIGVVVIITDLTHGTDELLKMRSNVGRHIVADSEVKQQLQSKIETSEEKFLQTLITYKEIDDFPFLVQTLRDRGLYHLITNEDALLTEVTNDWQEYQRERDKTIILSNNGKIIEATLQTNGPAADRFDELITNYDKIVDLNNQLAKIMYEESQSVALKAAIYSGIAALATGGSAIIVAILISKRLTPPLEEIEEQAKKKIQKYLVESSITQKRNSSTSIQKKLVSEGSELAAVVKEVKYDGIVHEKFDRDQEWFNLIRKGRLVLLHLSSYPRHCDNEQMNIESNNDFDTREDNDINVRLLNSLVERFMQSSPTVPDAKLVIMTRKGSNLYDKIRKEEEIGVKDRLIIYLLSSSTQNPISTSDDGVLTISINQTSLILEAIRRTLQENPSSIVVIDNATELINRLGFDKVFSLMHSISDVVASFPATQIVILINKNAHEQKEIESLATLVNSFIK